MRTPILFAAAFQFLAGATVLASEPVHVLLDDELLSTTKAAATTKHLKRGERVGFMQIASIQNGDSLTWNAIKGEADPALFRDFLDRFPDSKFAGAARAKLALLQFSKPKETQTMSRTDGLFPFDGKWNLTFQGINETKGTSTAIDLSGFCKSNTRIDVVVEVTEGRTEFTLPQTPVGSDVSLSQYPGFLNHDRGRWNGAIWAGEKLDIRSRGGTQSEQMEFNVSSSHCDAEIILVRQ